MHCIFAVAAAAASWARPAGVRCGEVDRTLADVCVCRRRNTSHQMLYLVLGAAAAASIDPLVRAELASRVLSICSCTHNSATVQASQRLPPLPPCIYIAVRDEQLARQAVHSIRLLLAAATTKMSQHDVRPLLSSIV